MLWVISILYVHIWVSKIHNWFSTFFSESQTISQFRIGSDALLPHFGKSTESIISYILNRGIKWLIDSIVCLFIFYCRIFDKILIYFCRKRMAVHIWLMFTTSNMIQVSFQWRLKHEKRQQILKLTGLDHSDI